MPSKIRITRIFRSSCAFAKCHPGLYSLFENSVVSNNSVSGRWRPWSDCASAQSDLGLRRPHISRRQIFAWLAHISIRVCNAIFTLRRGSSYTRRNITKGNINIYHICQYRSSNTNCMRCHAALKEFFRLKIHCHFKQQKTFDDIIIGSHTTLKVVINLNGLCIQVLALW